MNDKQAMASQLRSWGRESRRGFVPWGGVWVDDCSWVGNVRLPTSVLAQPISIYRQRNDVGISVGVRDSGRDISLHRTSQPASQSVGRCATET